MGSTSICTRAGGALKKLLEQKWKNGSGIEESGDTKPANSRKNNSKLLYQRLVDWGLMDQKNHEYAQS